MKGLSMLCCRNTVVMPFAVIVQKRRVECVRSAKKVDRYLKKQPWAMSTSVLTVVESKNSSFGSVLSYNFLDFFLCSMHIHYLCRHSHHPSSYCRYDNKGCGRSYLSQRDLDAHILYRHSKDKPLAAPIQPPGLKNPMPSFPIAFFQPGIVRPEFIPVSHTYTEFSATHFFFNT